MVVLCIKEPMDGLYGTKPIIKTGNFYHVISYPKWKRSKDVYYELAEHEGYTYRSDFFAPCSEIDEMELVNKKHLINQ